MSLDKADKVIEGHPAFDLAGTTYKKGAPFFAFLAKGGHDAANSADFDSAEISWRKRHRTRPFAANAKERAPFFVSGSARSEA